MYIQRFRRFCAIGFPVLLFAYAIHQLFMLRFDHGDFYPAYSSLRADPLGTRILYESLERLPGLNVRRNYTRMDQAMPEGRVVMFYAGASLNNPVGAAADPLEQYEEPLRDFVLQGGRLVVTFHPTMHVPGAAHREGAGQAFRDRLRKLAGEEKEMRELLSPVDRYSLWGVNFGFAPLPFLGKLDQDEAAGRLQPVSWHSTLYFLNWGEAWRPVLRRGEDRVVMLERQWGAGSVVLSSDSYFLSNEAMIAERRSELLAFILGDHEHVVFDESHHAIVRQQNIAGLARKYRLHGGLVSLVLLAALFVWKNTVSLVPPHPSTVSRSNVVESDKDASEGLRILLQRNIQPRKLLPLCLEEWERACLRVRVGESAADAAGREDLRRDGMRGISSRGNAERRHLRMREIVESGNANPVASYRKVCEALHAKE